MVHGVNAFVADVAARLAPGASLRVARAAWSRVRKRDALRGVEDALLELHRDYRANAVGGTMYAQALLACLEAFEAPSGARRVCAVFGDGALDGLVGSSTSMTSAGEYWDGVYSDTQPNYGDSKAVYDFCAAHDDDLAECSVPHLALYVRGFRLGECHLRGPAAGTSAGT